MATNLVEGVLIAVATTAAFSYLAKLAMQSRPVSAADGRLILQYPALLRVGGTIMSIGLVVLGAAVPASAGNPRGFVDTLVIWSIAVFIGSLGVYGALEFPFVRIEVREDGLFGRSPWRPSRLIPWHAVESVRFSPGAQWFVIRSTEGQAIRAHLYLSGIRQLYVALERHAPPCAWENSYGPFEGPT